MRPAIVLIVSALVLGGCAGNGGHKHMTQHETWESLGYKDGLKTVQQIR
ncbi:MAG: hypothetical protein LKH33_04680 [Acetobacter sp.]|jgi:hypothetical protein|nr:hypothetical protein [Acetobacter sp.]MCH4062036.1 hypothetical protein [Acetobacter sp.]MCH4089115.1 hypothetical protein [Acetobacter sp.]MCI1293159.1 hypothetical protein [Acetobacter sp.]MCI1320216.1 hypothetical protein [Acetobacter sp.]